MSEKKRCPFCASSNVVVTDDVQKCLYCGSEAAGNWNTRPIEDALQARIEALEVKAKALDLLVEMARAGEMIEIHEDAGMFFVQSYHYSDDLPTAIAAAYTAWREE